MHFCPCFSMDVLGMQQWVDYWISAHQLAAWHTYCSCWWWEQLTFTSTSIHLIVWPGDTWAQWQIFPIILGIKSPLCIGFFLMYCNDTLHLSYHHTVLGGCAPNFQAHALAKVSASTSPRKKEKRVNIRKQWQKMTYWHVQHFLPCRL